MSSGGTYRSWWPCSRSSSRPPPSSPPGCSLPAGRYAPLPDPRSTYQLLDLVLAIFAIVCHCRWCCWCWSWCWCWRPRPRPRPRQPLHAPSLGLQLLFVFGCAAGGEAKAAHVQSGRGGRDAGQTATKGRLLSSSATVPSARPQGKAGCFHVSSTAPFLCLNHCLSSQSLDTHSQNDPILKVMCRCVTRDHDYSLTFQCLLTVFIWPSTVLSLPFLGLPLPFLCLPLPFIGASCL